MEVLVSIMSIISSWTDCLGFGLNWHNQNKYEMQRTLPDVPNWGNNDCIVKDPSKVCQINVGDMFFMKGMGYPTGVKGLVHKSPPVQYHPDGFAMNRLVLKVDVPLQWNPWEPVVPERGLNSFNFLGSSLYRCVQPTCFQTVLVVGTCNAGSCYMLYPTAAATKLPLLPGDSYLEQFSGLSSWFGVAEGSTRGGFCTDICMRWSCTCDLLRTCTGLYLRYRTFARPNLPFARWSWKWSWDHGMTKISCRPFGQLQWDGCDCNSDNPNIAKYLGYAHFRWTCLLNLFLFHWMRSRWKHMIDVV